MPTATIVQGNRSGPIARPRDCESLRATMDRLSALSPSVRRELGRALQVTMAAGFDIRRVVDRWEEVYGELPS